MKVKYETAGPLSSVFSSPEAKVLDQALLVGNMKQTIPMLEESTGLSFKTVQKVLQRLSGIGFVTPAGKIGNAKAYQFRVEHELHELIEWASKYHFEQKLGSFERTVKLR
jgi:hypothetical protein